MKDIISCAAVFVFVWVVALLLGYLFLTELPPVERFASLDVVSAIKIPLP
jgi:hypothetical protein